MIFGVYPYCCISQQFILFYFWVVCHEWISSIFIHSPVEGHLGCFLVLMVKNRAAKIFVYRFCMNIGFHFTWVKTQECLCIFKSLSLTAIQKKKKNKQTKKRNFRNGDFSFLNCKYMSVVWPSPMSYHFKWIA